MRVFGGRVEGMGYDAFISYSHAADGRLAPALQSALHRFAKPWWKLRAVSVFRDETSLAAAHDLTGSIRSALESAHYFILLASPGSARSAWVEREVALWLAHKPIENVLIVLTDGRIAWSDAGDFNWTVTDALPRAFAGVFKAEPLWVDLSWARSSEQLSTDDPRFQQTVARLAARLHGRSLDEIAGEEVRQHRRTRLVARGAIASIACLALAALVGAWFSYRGQLRAERNLEQALLGVNVLAKLVARDMQDDFAAVPVELRLKMLREAESVLINLETGGERAAVQPSRAATLNEFASSYGTLGKYGEANARVAEAIALLQEHARANPSDLRAAAELAKGHKVHGELLWWQRQRVDEAIVALGQGAEGLMALAQAQPGHADAEEWRLLAFRTLVTMGDVYVSGAQAQGATNAAVCAAPEPCRTRAEETIHRALALTDIGVDEIANEFRWRNAMLAARQRLARIAEGRGDLAGARAVYVQIGDAYREMSTAMPKHLRWKENRLGMHWSIGRVGEQLCDLQGAHDDYAAALELARELHRIEPGRIDWHRHLSRSLTFAARAAYASGSFDVARKFDEESRSHNLILIERRPGDQELKREIEEASARLDGPDGPRLASCAPTKR
jgi:tetratricopeptide (TPR) repeat protein